MIMLGTRIKLKPLEEIVGHFTTLRRVSIDRVSEIVEISGFQVEIEKKSCQFHKIGTTNRTEANPIQHPSHVI